MRCCSHLLCIRSHSPIALLRLHQIVIDEIIIAAAEMHNSFLNGRHGLLIDLVDMFLALFFVYAGLQFGHDELHASSFVTFDAEDFMNLRLV